MYEQRSFESSYDAVLFQPLERRALRSATLVGTELQIVGTHLNDGITVSLKAGDPSTLVVKVRKAEQEFQVQDVSRIVIRGGTGNDNISISQANGTIKIDSKIYGGAGDDNVSGGKGRDRVYGGDGNDTVNGNGGNDIEYGEAGDDSLSGSTGRDLLDGGLDDDTLKGGA